MSNHSSRLTRIFGAAMAVVVLVAAVPMAANAATIVDGGTTGSLTWVLDSDGVLTISGIGAMPNYDGMMNYPPWSGYATDITKVVIADGVTTIGRSAFGQLMTSPQTNYSNLTEVIIPNSVTSIGQQAFSHSGLTSLNIPNTVETIGLQAFGYCQGLTSVTIGSNVNNIGQQAFQQCDVLSSAIFKGDAPATFGNNVFQNAAGGFTIYYDPGTTGWDNPTANLAAYPRMPIPGTSGTFGDDLEWDFNETTGTLTITGSGAMPDETAPWNFYTANITSVSLSDGLTSICANAFSNTKITSVDIPNTVTTIGANAFQNTGLTSIVIPNSVTSIGNSAFRNCGSLTEVIIPNSVTTIGQRAFQDCGLQSVTLPDNPTFTIIEEYAFRGTKLTTVTIPNSVTTIRGYSFSYCNSLTTVHIGSGVTVINDMAFGTASSQSNLETVYFASATKPSESSSSFVSKSGARAIVPNTWTQAEGTLMGNSQSDQALIIEYAVPPAITTASLPSGTYNTAYNQTLAATGTVPITWSVTVGDLPDGLSLNPATGEISGTPTKAGKFDFTVQAANYINPNATRELSITIDKAPAPTITFPTSSAAITYGQTLASATLNITSDAHGTFNWTTPTTAPTVAQSGTSFGVTYTPTDTDNYDYTDVTLTATVAVTVNKATGSFGTPSALSATWSPTLTLASITPPTNYAWATPSTSVTVAGDNQPFPATYTHPSGNYTDASGDIIVNVEKADQAKPNAPTATPFTTATTITLNDITGAEYCRNSGASSCTAESDDWQDEVLFSGLTPNTPYTFVARLKGDGNRNASPSSDPSAAISTNKATLAGTVTISGDAVYGQTLSAVTSALTSEPDIGALGTLTYQWYRYTAGSLSAGIPIADATGATYVLAAGDIGQVIKVSVQAANCDPASYRWSDATAEVAKAPVTITGLSASDKTYDGNATATPTGTAVVSGRVGTDDVTVTSGTASFANANVGTAKAVTFSGYALGGTAVGNYTLSAQPASVTANITAAPLTIKADNIEIKVGDSEPTYTYTPSGFVNGETAAVITTAPTFALSPAFVNTQEGAFTITPSGAAAANYAISYQTGTLTLTHDPANVTIVNGVKDALAAEADLYPKIVAQATANTQLALRGIIQKIIDDLDPADLNGVSLTITDEVFTAAVMGDAQNKDGMNGVYKFKVELAKNYYNVKSAEITVSITAIPYEMTSVLSPDRNIPQTKPDEGAAVIAPVNVSAFEVTVGPNPVRKSDGVVNIFVTGKRVGDGTLTVFDATGNVVRKIDIRDNAAPGKSGSRVVGSWDLKDVKGRHVAEGTYLLRGVVKTVDGKREKVSVIIGVR